MWDLASGWRLRPSYHRGGAWAGAGGGSEDLQGLRNLKLDLTPFRRVSPACESRAGRRLEDGVR